MINILSQETINKIAAGEVVERPLNAVKELVENALDACANSVGVEISGAGKKLIRISDNGIGMGRKDLELSVVRHATSKISDFNDLSHIQSMGFRGEALASIAAVSRFEIKTREKGESSGWKLSTEGGKNTAIAPWSGAEGTITEVKDLFFNTPARHKFLKSDATERSRIMEIIEETALANPEINFKLISENKIVFQTSKTDDKIARISDILGGDFAGKLKNIKIEREKISFDIYFTGRDDAQVNKKYQYLFVNSRPVNLPKFLIACVYQAYRETIPRDRHPGILIYISIDPQDIDVNIHPAKREIKFADESAIFDLLYKALRGALTTHAHPHLMRDEHISPSVLPVIADKYEVSARRSVSQSENKEKSYVNPPLQFNDTKSKYGINQYANVFAKQNGFAAAPESQKEQSVHLEPSALSGGVDALPQVFGDNVKVLGQVFDAYIIAESAGELYIFDQHAAAERVRYEIYLSQSANQSLKLQQLLMPETFELPSSLSELLKSNLNIFNELGIETGEFGDNSFRVTAYPALLGDSVSLELIIKKNTRRFRN
ncbi:MAG: DNA mismatch repair endonuclease MutL [Endomicrobium sp.]|nr:DNA mismatch repair endonuclease MutL [Endomicrobium sp.]